MTVSMINRILHTATAFAAIFAATVVHAADADEGRALVDRFVNEIDTLYGEFEQRLIDANGELLEVSSGRLYIDRPGRFRWVYDEPYEQWLVADGRNIWNYDVDLAQVTVKPQAKALASTPALLLGGAESAMDEFVYDGTYRTAGLVWARLRPVDTSSGFRQVELAFSDGVLVRMVFLDNLEQTTLVTLHDVEVNQPIEASVFEFEMPDDVDVVGTPVLADTDTP